MFTSASGLPIIFSRELRVLQPISARSPSKVQSTSRLLLRLLLTGKPSINRERLFPDHTTAKVSATPTQLLGNRYYGKVVSPKIGSVCNGAEVVYQDAIGRKIIRRRIWSLHISSPVVSV